MTKTASKSFKTAIPSSKHKKSTAKAPILVAEVRRKLGVSRKAFSRLTGYSERAIATWEAGRKPDEPSLRRIKETERFQDRLATLVRPEEIPAWLDAPNDAFDGLKPIEVIERGEIDRLWSMIFYLESGVAS
jgi:DNA-binding transcriptional regulator YiaG